jgi:hypothetical protein
MQPPSHADSISRRRFVQLAALSAGGMALPPSLAASAQSMRSAMTSSSAACAETATQIMNMAATVEALLITFYYQAISAPTGFFDRLSNNFQTYLRTMLAQEWAHYEHLQTLGGSSSTSTFYFLPDQFGFNGFSHFLLTMDALETTSIALYLATAQRCSEIEQPQLAELAGQLAGVEAEHRVLGREMSRAPPKPRNDLCFEQASVGCVTQAVQQLSLFLSGMGKNASPFRLPSASQVAQVIGSAGCAAVMPAVPTDCSESLKNILDIAATAEALGATFYYHGIRSDFFSTLSNQRQWYLQAALDEEHHHLDFLIANSGALQTNQFFFPANVFNDLAAFLHILETLENAFIGAYLNAMQRFAQLGQPTFVAVSGQILGIEAEHRILGRIMAGQMPPNDRCLAQDNFTCLSDVVSAMTPFLSGDTTFNTRTVLPGNTEINSTVDRFGCTAVAPAPAPVRIYLPTIAK